MKRFQAPRMMIFRFKHHEEEVAVVAHDNDLVVLKMSSFDPGSSYIANTSLKKVKGKKPARDESMLNDRGANGACGESKLELFGFDSLVNILGLKRMTGEQIPSSPKIGEDASASAHNPKWRCQIGFYDGNIYSMLSVLKM